MSTLAHQLRETFRARVPRISISRISVSLVGVALLVASGACSEHVDAVTPTDSFVAGQTYFGSNSYIEYQAGNAPVLLTAPHGGELNPENIPDRTAAACGGVATIVTDLNTAELVRSMRVQYYNRFGQWPHVVISHLSRRKLDPNRPEAEAACGNADAKAVLNDWTTYINAARAEMVRGFGKGWYMDIHGHGHTKQRLELGYLLSPGELNRTDAALDASASFEKSSSIRTMSQYSPLSFSALFRGASSLGTLYANNGFPSIPSAQDAMPAGDQYFDGGENTRIYTCSAASNNPMVCGVQIETNYTGVRDNATNRARFGTVTANVLEEYLRTHWGLRLTN